VFLDEGTGFAMITSSGWVESVTYGYDAQLENWGYGGWGKGESQEREGRP